jgi:hypothetical protein
MDQLSPRKEPSIRKTPSNIKTRIANSCTWKLAVHSIRCENSSFQTLSHFSTPRTIQSESSIIPEMLAEDDCQHFVFLAAKWSSRPAQRETNTRFLRFLTRFPLAHRKNSSLVQAPTSVILFLQIGKLMAGRQSDKRARASESRIMQRLDQAHELVAV